MRDHDIGFLPVGENDRLIGTLTDRDIVIRVVASRKDPVDVPVSEAMSKKLFYCFDDQSIDEICQNMASMQVLRMPVVNRAKRLVGAVSFTDLAKAATATVYCNAKKQIGSAPSAKKAA
jgi:CBS domain-containing protein